MIRTTVINSLCIIFLLLLSEVTVRLFFPELEAKPLKDVLGYSTREYRAFDPRQADSSTNNRIVFLGDSFLAIKNSRFPEIYRENYSPETHIVTLSAGGWGTDQEYLAYFQKGRQLKSKLVVLAFCPINDLSNIFSSSIGFSMKPKPYFVLEDNGRLQLYDVEGNASTEEDFAKSLIGGHFFQSYLFDSINFVFKYFSGTLEQNNRLLQRVESSYSLYNPKRDNRDGKKAQVVSLQTELDWSPQLGVNNLSAYIHESFEMNTRQWALFEAILVRLNRLVEESQSRLVVMLLPVPLDGRNLDFIPGSNFKHRFNTPHGPFTFHSDEASSRIGAITERLGISFFDPTPEFFQYVLRNNALGRFWPQNGDHHFKKIGHQLLAKLLDEYLKKPRSL